MFHLRATRGTKYSQHREAEAILTLPIPLCQAPSHVCPTCRLSYPSPQPQEAALLSLSLHWRDNRLRGERLVRSHSWATAEPAHKRESSDPGAACWLHDSERLTPLSGPRLPTCALWATGQPGAGQRGSTWTPSSMASTGWPANKAVIAPLQRQGTWGLDRPRAGMTPLADLSWPVGSRPPVGVGVLGGRPVCLVSRTCIQSRPG